MDVDQFAQLTTFERRILSFVLAIEAPELLAAICDLRVLERRSTGVGMFIYLRQPKPSATKLDAAYGSSAFAYREGWDDLVRCQIAVSGGVVDHIELFANHTNSFPDDLDALKLGYMDVVPMVPPVNEQNS